MSPSHHGNVLECVQHNHSFIMAFTLNGRNLSTFANSYHNGVSLCHSLARGNYNVCLFVPHFRSNAPPQHLISHSCPHPSHSISAKCAFAHHSIKQFPSTFPTVAATAAALMMMIRLKWLMGWLAVVGGI